MSGYFILKAVTAAFLARSLPPCEQIFHAVIGTCESNEPSGDQREPRKSCCPARISGSFVAQPSIILSRTKKPRRESGADRFALPHDLPARSRFRGRFLSVGRLIGHRGIGCLGTEAIENPPQVVLDRVSVGVGLVGRSAGSGVRRRRQSCQKMSHHESTREVRGLRRIFFYAGWRTAGLLIVRKFQKSQGRLWQETALR